MHLYWRINILTCAAGIYGALSEIALLVAGVDQIGGGTAFASSEQGDHPAAAALQNNTNYWGGAGPLPVYWGYHFPTPVAIDQVIITPSPGLLPYYPTTWTLDYSDDGAAWTTQEAFTSAAWVGSTPQSFGAATPAGLTQVSAFAAEIIATSSPPLTVGQLTLESVAAASNPVTHVAQFFVETVASTQVATFGMSNLVCAAMVVTENNAISLRWSDDRGASWRNAIEQPLGDAGQYDRNVSFRRLGMSRDRCFSLEWSSPYPISLDGCWLNFMISTT